MAPFIGPTREKVISLLTGKNTPERITLGYLEPHAQIIRRGEAWCLENLVRDEVAIERAYQESQVKGYGFMPENAWLFKAEGEIVLTAKSAAELSKKIQNWAKWPYGPR